jgi:hypothetical protein
VYVQPARERDEVTGEMVTPPELNLPFAPNFEPGIYHYEVGL